MEFQNGRKEKHHEGAHTEQAGGPRCRGKQPIGQQLHLLKKTKKGVKSGAKYGHIKTDTDDNGDTVVHITIKSTGKDKKKQVEQ